MPPHRYKQEPTRITPKPLVGTGKMTRIPPADHPAIVDGKPYYSKASITAPAAINLLVPGKNHWKIGSSITKGKWQGYPIYTLTLEERSTCPKSCRHWRSCFGNQMPWARRIIAGPELEARLPDALQVLQITHPGGFAVRLHVLGDFYSVEYVDLWRGWLDRFPALHVFGFSARWERSDPIAAALVALVLRRWDRFAIRFSNAPVDECSTVTVEHVGQVPDDAILCPQQTGQTENCGKCALCWQSRDRIAFLQH